MKQILLITVAFCLAFSVNAQNQRLNQEYSFIENKGQIIDQNGHSCPNILFTSTIGSAKIFLGKTGVHYVLEKAINRPAADLKTESDLFIQQTEKYIVESYRTDLELIDANPDPVIQTLEPSSDFLNYYLTNQKEGILGVRHFAKIVYKDVYPGIDWVWYNKEGVIKYDFVVSPGADYKQIKIKVDGASSINLLENGGLGIETPLGKINENEPVSFLNGKETMAYFKLNENVISFNVPEAKKTDKLVIDPLVRIWSTYYGGEGMDLMYSIATGKNSKNVYGTGYTKSGTGIYFGGHQNYSVGSTNAFLVKFDENGNRKWGTYYVGYSTNSGGAMVVTDSMENIYVVGYTNAVDSVSYNGYQGTYGGGSADAFLVKFNENGARIWGTYYGGSGLDIGSCATLSNKGGIWIGGRTASSTGLSSSGNTSYRGNNDGFFAHFDSTGSRTRGEYFGGTDFDEILSMVAADNDVYFVGDTRSTSGISKNGYQSSYGSGVRDAFVAKYGTSLIWATYYGGGGVDYAYGISIDNNNNIYVSGESTSSTKIASTGSYQSTLRGSSDAFLVKFDENGSRVWGTYFGGELAERAAQSCVSTSGEITMVGFSNSQTGVASGVYQNNNKGGYDIILAKFNNSGALLWGTYFGDSLDDFGLSIAYDTDKNIYIGGYTYSLKNIAQGGHQNISNGDMEGFLTKFIDLNTIPTGLGLSDYTICGKLTVNHVVNNRPSNKYVTRWYDSEAGNTWLHEGDTFIKTYTQTDTVWVAFDNGSNRGSRLRTIITILLASEASFTVNDSTQCSNSNSFIFTNLTDTSLGGITYYWNFDDGNTSSSFHTSKQYLNAGIYMVYFTVTNKSSGCTSRQTMPIEVKQSPFQVITGKTVSVQGDTERYSAIHSTGSTYVWSITGGTQISGGNTDSITVKWGNGILGDVVLVETDVNGCESRPAGLQISLSPSMIPDGYNQPFSLLPNPASHNVNLVTHDYGTYSIIDVLGKELLSAEVNPYEPVLIDISELPQGTYLFFFRSGASTYRTKIVVN